MVAVEQEPQLIDGVWRQAWAEEPAPETPAEEEIGPE